MCLPVMGFSWSIRNIYLLPTYKPCFSIGEGVRDCCRNLFMVGEVRALEEISVDLVRRCQSNG